ncbi:GH26 endo-beta-1,4-mannanase [Stachybotrys elegans]|uniref:GH26 endo-beta-1,4-mannanase n=1 Tax=Stachybotrys elegans TaxID=80388 RepID=A0A8K0SMB5_9HYPO|nr:GH26 endo-beta-1,4-mannanase [Stachybotrys elegans]
MKSILFLAQLALVAAAPSGSAAKRKACSALHFEAEDALISGTNSVLTELAGYSGTGYVGRFEAADDRIRFEIPSEEQGLYDLTITYAGIYGEKRASVVLNSGASEEVYFAQSTGFEDAPAGQVLLQAGDNTLDIVSNWGWYVIDSITLTPTPARPPHNIDEDLVNPAANANAKALYAFLKDNYGKRILSGQQDHDFAAWVEQQVGKAPAIYQGDIGTAVEEGIDYHGRGGILTFCWHWNAPVGLYDTAEQPWWRGFYTEATDFNIAAALQNPESNANYTLLIRDIDAIAEELLRLQDAGSPILWRPLHEAEGGWFWWGAQGPEPVIELWRIMYDRLTNHHGLNNLIWVWNSVDPAWYPGDEYVDIVSADSYTQGNGPLSGLYNQLVDLGSDRKIVAATEVGAAPRPELLELYQAHWSWFVVWTEPYINDPVWNSPEILQEIYDSEYTLTLDEIQGWLEQYS